MEQRLGYGARVFTLRFDMRAPDWGAPAADLYAAAVDMCEWAETRGAVLVVLSEHHGAEDGHRPAPLMLASAIAARTRQLAILLRRCRFRCGIRSGSPRRSVCWI